VIGIDTNLLVRILIKDDEIQAQKAKKIIEQNKSAFISVLVLCETIWILESRYEFVKKDIVLCLETILKTQQFEIEHRDIVWAALKDYQHISSVGFSDCVIGAIGKAYGCKYVVTFDKKAAKLENFNLL